MSEQSAIQSDVPVQQAAEDSHNPTHAPQKTAREQMLEEMELRHQRQIAEANGYTLEDAEPQPALDTDPAPAPEPAPAANAPAQPEQDQLAAQMAANEPSGLPSTVKIKVNGMEQDVPFDEVVRQYQKNSSADQRLAEATRLLREAQEVAAQRLLESQRQPVQEAPAAAPVAQPDPTPAVDVKATGKEFLKALFEGDEDNALAKLEEVITNGRPPVAQQAPQQPILDINELSSAVAQHVQQKLQVESALAKHRADYPQLYADPDMEALALTKVERLRAETGADFFMALNDVSAQMADKFGWNRQQEQGRQPEAIQPTNSRREAKLERKAGIDNLHSVNTKTATSEPQPESASDVIAQMRAARGG